MLEHSLTQRLGKNWTGRESVHVKSNIEHTCNNQFESNACSYNFNPEPILPISSHKDIIKQRVGVGH